LKRKYKGKPMAKKEKQKPDTITLPNGKEFVIQDLKEKEQVLTHHLRDQQNKMNNMRFNLEQIQIGYDACLSMLHHELGEEMPEPEGEVVEQV
jgi:hypothetical protein